MWSDLPSATQAVVVFIGGAALLSLAMCTVAPPDVRSRWRRAARNSAPRSIALAPPLVWSSSAITLPVRVHEYLLVFAVVAGIYCIAGFQSSRHLALAYPEEWRAVKDGLGVAPDVKRRIDEEITRSMLVATGVVVAILIPIGLAIVLT